MSFSGQQGQVSTPTFAESNLPHQGRSVAAIASLYLMRMLGLFMVLPVLTLYGKDYTGSNAMLLGMALGAYGFSQALLQIPFGWWSDHWGRRPVITIGLLLFALGSIVAANSTSVYGLILGRFLQGSGAIASALMALVADSTSEQHRSKAMAVIGVSIGVSFSIALIAGPLVTRWGGLSGVFWVTAGLAAIGLLILYTLIPVPTHPAQASVEGRSFRRVLRDKELLRLDFGILVLHMVLMANFVVIPGLLESVADIDRSHHWWVYLPVLVGSFILMLPLMLLGERRGRLKPVFLGAIGIMLAAELLLVLFRDHAWLLLSALFAFFVAFNLLEASLPSQVSKMAPTSLRGAASGVYSSSQFFGAFAGGTLGGAALTLGGPIAVFAVNLFALALWLWIASSMHVKRPMVQAEAVKTGEPQRIAVERSANRELESA